MNYCSLISWNCSGKDNSIDNDEQAESSQHSNHRSKRKNIKRDKKQSDQPQKHAKDIDQSSKISDKYDEIINSQLKSMRQS